MSSQPFTTCVGASTRRRSAGPPRGAASLPCSSVTTMRGPLLAWFVEHGRDLPWRRTRDPYAILVSEVMLQQTQVERVVPRYLAWLERWPTPGSSVRSSGHPSAAMSRAARCRLTARRL